MAFSPSRRRFLLNAPAAYEQLQFLFKPDVDFEGLTPLGIPGFAGFFLSLLERDGWAISITPAFAGEPGDLLIIAAHEDEHVEYAGPPAVAAVEVYKQANALNHERRRRTMAIA